MKFAYFPGCKLPFYLKEYGDSFEAVMGKLGVELVNLPFNCCGYPSRNKSFETSVFSSIRNLSLAQKHDLDLITPCKCCLGQFKQAVYWWHNHPGLKTKIKVLLKKEGLFWNGKTQIKHYLSFLHKDLGPEKLKDVITQKHPGHTVVVQYGCHALRPFSITGFDNPYSPHIFEALINLTGLKTIEWSKRTECCGNPVHETNKKLSLNILRSKLTSASDCGADFICTACTHCQMQYNDMGIKKEAEKLNIKPVLFTHILGLAMGLDIKELGIKAHPFLNL